MSRTVLFFPRIVILGREACFVRHKCRVLSRSVLCSHLQRLSGKLTAAPHTPLPRPYPPILPFPLPFPPPLAYHIPLSQTWQEQLQQEEAKRLESHAAWEARQKEKDEQAKVSTTHPLSCFGSTYARHMSRESKLMTAPDHRLVWGGRGYTTA